MNLRRQKEVALYYRLLPMFLTNYMTHKDTKITNAPEYEH